MPRTTSRPASWIWLSRDRRGAPGWELTLVYVAGKGNPYDFSSSSDCIPMYKRREMITKAWMKYLEAVAACFRFMCRGWMEAYIVLL